MISVSGVFPCGTHCFHGALFRQEQAPACDVCLSDTDFGCDSTEVSRWKSQTRSVRKVRRSVGAPQDAVLAARSLLIRYFESLGK